MAAEQNGLDKPEASLLQLEFSENNLMPKQLLETAGICDATARPLCCVLGVGAALVTRQIRKVEATNIVKSAEGGRWADVQFIC